MKFIMQETMSRNGLTQNKNYPYIFRIIALPKAHINLWQDTAIVLLATIIHNFKFTYHTSFYAFQYKRKKFKKRKTFFGTFRPNSSGVLAIRAPLCLYGWSDDCGLF